MTVTAPPDVLPNEKRSVMMSPVKQLERISGRQKYPMDSADSLMPRIASESARVQASGS